MERGVLVFEGVNGTPVTCGAGIGAVLTVDGREFMHVAGGCWARADARGFWCRMKNCTCTLWLTVLTCRVCISPIGGVVRCKGRVASGASL